MMIVVKNNPPLSDDQLTGFEQRIGARLPAGYRDFLQHNNGGEPAQPEFVFAHGDGDSVIGFFYGIDAGPPVRRFDWALEVYANRVPADLLPVAKDVFGNLICIGLSGEYRDKVLFWDHELESPTDEPTRENLTIVADDFETFLGLFEPAAGRYLID